jgi:hypothetical protein
MARKTKKYHYIYKTICNVTNRYYVGMHSTNNLNDDYLGSGKRLRASIRKHGADNHTKEILEYYDTRELLVEAEVESITDDMIGDKNCMNLMGGGTGGFISDEQQKHRSECGGKALHLKLKSDLEFKKEWRDKMVSGINRAYSTGKKDKNWGKDWTGKKHSEETKLKMRKPKNVGENNSQFGKCWITNEKENKKIMRGDTIPDGWRLGRVIK